MRSGIVLLLALFVSGCPADQTAVDRPVAEKPVVKKRICAPSGWTMPTPGGAELEVTPTTLSPGEEFAAKRDGARLTSNVLWLFAETGPGCVRVFLSSANGDGEPSVSEVRTDELSIVTMDLHRAAVPGIVPRKAPAGDYLVCSDPGDEGACARIRVTEAR
jgi:hypothetical protein